MIKIKLNLFWLLMPFIFFSFLLALSASADGGMVVYDPLTSNWDLKDINQQICAINYENGIENMILSIKVDSLDGEKAVWIFPVPAKPELPNLWYNLIKVGDS